MNVHSHAAEQFRVPPQRAVDLAKLGFSSEEMYRIAPPRRPLARRRKHDELLTLAESDRVHRLERISNEANRVFGSEEKANRWLRKPNRALEKAVPIDLLESETGAQVVEEMLVRIEHGMFS